MYWDKVRRWGSARSRYPYAFPRKRSTESFMCYVEYSSNHSAYPMPSGEPEVILEGVLTLGG